MNIQSIFEPSNVRNVTLLSNFFPKISFEIEKLLRGGHIMHHDEGDEFMQQKIAGNVGCKVAHLFYIFSFANDKLQHHKNQKMSEYTRKFSNVVIYLKRITHCRAFFPLGILF